MAESAPKDKTGAPEAGHPADGADGTRATSPPQIPDHQLLRCIGRGAYGEVWLARNVMSTLRAVKVVYRRSFDTDRPYEREFAGIEKFEPISRSHEGLVDILHVGRNNEAGYFFYVMELADHVQSSSQIDSERYEPRTLQRDIQQRGRLPLAECLSTGLSLSNALGHLHKEGLVHRDIKPSNIIFVKGTPKLADIGLVCGTEATQSYVGTEGYIPPEGPGTPLADVYSLGKVLYEMSTGKDRHDFPDLPTDLRGEKERTGVLELNEVLLKACAGNLRQRYQSAEQMESDLALIQLGKSVKRRRAAQQRRTVAKAIGLAAVIAMMVLATLLLVNRQNSRRNATMNSTARSIAVLPFLNESPDKEDEFLSKAIPDEVITALTPMMKVAARNSSFAYQPGEDARLIGQRLGVSAVLAGSVRKAADKLDVRLQLISTSDGYQLTAQRYEKNIQDLPVLHNLIARWVAGALKVPLAVEEARELEKRPTENLEAWKLYLLGRQHWNHRMKPGQIQMAGNYFAQAIAKDTNFALAYAVLAQTYADRGYLSPGDLPPREAFPKATHFAMRALSINPRLAEAYTSLAWSELYYDWNGTKAENDLRQAITINSSYAEAHHAYSHVLMPLGRANESLRESKLALQSDPIDPIINAHLGWHYLYNRQYGEAIQQWQNSIALDPEFPMYRWFLGCAYEQTKDFANAIENFNKAVELSKRRPLMLTSLGHAYGKTGNRTEAQKILAELNERAKTEYVDQVEVSFVYIGLDDKEQALKCLDKAYEDRSGWLVYLNLDPHFDSLRDHPHFKELVKQVGIPVTE